MNDKKNLTGRKIAILATDGFEQSELADPKKTLEKHGATTAIVAPKSKIRGWKHTDWGDKFSCDVPLDQARVDDFDALLLPGGVMNPDHLRIEPKAIAFVRDFVASGKPVAAICHGPVLLAEAGVLRGRHITSYPAIKTDMINAGATWTDEEVVVDKGLVTSRKPDDIPAFTRKFIEEILEGRHQRRPNGAQPTSKPSSAL